MAEHNVKINVKTDTGYDQLYPKSKSDIIDFDKTNSNLSSTDVESAIKEVNTKTNTNKTNIGTLSSLTTDSKTNLVGAINEVDSHANTNKTNIGTLSSLKTSVKNSIVNAINWLYDNVVHKTSVIDNLDDIVANQADGMVAGAKAVAELNSKIDGIVTSVGMDTQYCSVWKSGVIGIVTVNGPLKNAIGKWQEVTLFTSSILPKWTTYGVATDQNGNTADIMINESGKVILSTRNKDVSDTWYRGQIVFVVE